MFSYVNLQNIYLSFGICIVPFSLNRIWYNNKFVITITDKQKDDESIRANLKKWYKKQTMEITSNRAAHYAKQMNVTYAGISIKSRKSQWGTCDSNGNLTFHWRLSMATPDAVDYVVVHELCHRRHMDHSKQFWGQVKTVLPDYLESRAWLEENSINLSL